jgi:hypothetical protein
MGDEDDEMMIKKIEGVDGTRQHPQRKGEMMESGGWRLKGEYQPKEREKRRGCKIEVENKYWELTEEELRRGK